jgi:outer membrane lipoprotein SlyB
MGNHEIVLDLQSVNLNGQRYALNTQDLTQTGNNGDRGIGANKRTGEYVGGGAILGTLLGAVAGGGRGAAIGALAGAAAGAGTQVLTRGSEVKVPAETVLTFQLDQPVYLYQ